MKTIKSKLDVVITATVRADILRLTLITFSKNFLHQFNVRVIINVDPVGETDKNTQADMVDICREYFDEVIYRTPSKPSFPKAARWVWQQIETDFFLNMEDDWVLRSPIDVNEIMRLFNDHDTVNVLFGSVGEDDLYRKHGNLEKIKINQRYYFRFPNLSLNPGIFRTAYIKDGLARFDVSKDPEFQFGGQNAKSLLFPKPVFLVYATAKGLAFDSGRVWRRKMFIGKGDLVTNPTWYNREKKNLKFVCRYIYYKLCITYWGIRYG